MEKKKDILGAVRNGGKAAAELLDRAKTTVVNAVDQNSDGKFDLKDLMRYQTEAFKNGVTQWTI